jgi:hypothetical protein
MTDTLAGSVNLKFSPSISSSIFWGLRRPMISLSIPGPDLTLSVLSTHPVKVIGTGVLVGMRVLVGNTAREAGAVCCCGVGVEFTQADSKTDISINTIIFFMGAPLSKNQSFIAPLFFSLQIV